ncbi:hypothetical protein, partial [Paenibacillus polymyxa]
IVFEFLLMDSEITDEAKWVLEHMLEQGKNEVVDSEREVLPDMQDVLVNMLHSIIEEWDC